jgi:hypothetical protein
VAINGSSARRAVASIALLLATVFVVPTTVPWLLPAGTVLGASCNGASHTVTLDDPGATPRTGTPSTAIVFTVTFRDSAGCAPTSVLAIVAGVGQVALSQTGGSFGSGMRYAGTSTLPVGRWTFSFAATAGTGGGAKGATVDATGFITIRAPSPSPTPTPTPTPTPKPTPKPSPTPRPTLTPRPTPAPTSKPRSAPAPTPRPTASPGSGGTVGPSAKPSASPKPPKNGGGSSKPAPSSSPLSDDWPDVGGGWEGRAGGPGPDGPLDGPGGAPGSGDSLRLPGLRLEAETGLSLATWLITTTGGVLLFALILRRGGEAALLPSELSALTLEAGRGPGRPARRPREPGDAAAAVATLDEPPTPAGGLGSTRSGPTGSRGLPTRPPLTFTDRPAKDAVRRLITYRHVRVSAGPDDLHYPEVARLERLDEVEIVGEQSGFVQVRTPDDITGWVPRVVFL